jgi:hypothetical protein
LKASLLRDSNCLVELRPLASITSAQKELYRKYQSFLSYVANMFSLRSSALVNPGAFTTEVATAMAQLPHRYLPEVPEAGAGMPSHRAQSTDDVHLAHSPLLELLIHLAAPLPSLERYLQAARCIIVSNALKPSDAATFRTRFVDVATNHSVDESSLVMDQIAAQDVDAWVRCMDVPPPPPPSTLPRVVLHFGRLSKKFTRGRHERLMLVFSDTLCYCEELKERKLRVRGVIPFTEPTGRTLDVANTAEEPPEENAFGFEVKSVTGQKFVFFAQTQWQQQYWVEVIRFAVKSAESSEKAAAAQRNSGEVKRAIRIFEDNAVKMNPKSRLQRQRREDKRIELRLMAQSSQLGNKPIGSHGSATPNLDDECGGTGSNVLHSRNPSGVGILSPSASLVQLASSAPRSATSGGQVTAVQLKLSAYRRSMRNSYDLGNWTIEAPATQRSHRRSHSNGFVAPPIDEEEQYSQKNYPLPQPPDGSQEESQPLVTAQGTEDGPQDVLTWTDPSPFRMPDPLRQRRGISDPGMEPGHDRTVRTAGEEVQGLLSDPD